MKSIAIPLALILFACSNPVIDVPVEDQWRLGCESDLDCFLIVSGDVCAGPSRCADDAILEANVPLYVTARSELEKQCLFGVQRGDSSSAECDDSPLCTDGTCSLASE